MMRLSASLLLLLIGAAGQETPTFRSESQVVLLDMVVRDKQGRPVNDVQSGDVEVFEDGSRCEIVSFRLVEAAAQLPSTVEAAPLAGEPSPGRAPATPRSGATPARASLVVLVFDQLGIEAALRVRQAADEFLSRPFPPDTWFAAIKIGQGLRLLQPFTTDPTRLPPAVERATRGGDVTRDAPIGAGGLASDSLTDQALDTLTQEMNRPTDQIGPPNVGAISGNMLFLTDQARRTQQGYGSLVPLISIAKSLQRVEGRKTVVYFSEGLYTPDAVQALFDTVIDQANRANMTVYSVDARGLTTRSPTETSRRMLGVAAGLSEQIESSTMKSKQGDVILAGLRGSNVQASMETLSLATGDRVIGRTNPRLPALDEEGRIAWVGSLPAEGFSPGRYELRVTASQGTHVAMERAAFEVVSRSSVTPVTPASVPAGVIPSSKEPADARPEAILQTAGRYVLEYERAFRDLVAEESYIQVAGGPAGGRRQVTRSDLVFVSTPGAVPWTSFRDVYEVNGQKVRDREARLEKLFRGGQTGDALAQADAIRAESSRYNIGPAVRNINVPTLALLFLHPQNQERFRFERKGRRAFSGIDAVEIEFVETRRPALVTDGISEDLPAKGRFWIDPFRGTVLRSDVTFRFMPNRATARVAVDYRPEHGLPIWVPSEMKEWYGDRPGASIPVFRGLTGGTARYSNYRRFTVTTEEKAEARP